MERTEQALAAKSLVEKPLSPYYQVQCQIFKTVFDGCGIIIENVSGKFECDNNFRTVHNRHSIQPSGISLKLLLSMTCPEEGKERQQKGYPIVLEKPCKQKKFSRFWRQFSIIQPPPQVAVPFSACIPCGVRGALSVELRDHVPPLPRCREIACVE